MSNSYSSQPRRGTLGRPGSRPTTAAATAIAGRRETRQPRPQTPSSRTPLQQKGDIRRVSSAIRTTTPRLNNRSLQRQTSEDGSTPRERGIASRSKRNSNAEPMNIDIDIAGKIGLAIDPDIFSNTTETATAANIAYVQAMNEDDYGSDDDLGDSEAVQAAKLRAGLQEEIERFDADLEKELLEADRRDYEANGEVLDQEVVAEKMKLLSSFASHLRQIGKNRANLLARLANPLAEEHWMLDSAYHQRMVDAVQSMCKIVNRLPEISEAARHCLSAPVPGSERSDGSLDVSSSADPRSRQIAQMERLVHEVEQAFEWIENGKTSRGAASILPTVSL